MSAPTSAFELDLVHDDRVGRHCADVDCPPCTRPGCGHHVCQHADEARARNGYGDCGQPGCVCEVALADDDCPGEDEFDGVPVFCNGTGGFEVDDPKGRSHTFYCTLCGGTGRYTGRAVAS